MANTKKSKKVLKVVTGVTSLALVGAISFGLTYAYLTATTNQKDNVFTAGNVDISVVEPTFSEEGTTKYAPGQNIAKDPAIDLAVTSNDAYVAMRVKFQVATGWDSTNNKWTYKNISYTEFQKYASLKYVESGTITGDTPATNSKWFMRNLDIDASTSQARDTTEGLVFYYVGNDSDSLEKVTKGTGDAVETPAVFTNVVFKDESDLKSLMIKDQTGKDVYPDIKIIVEGYAVQADNTDPLLSANTDNSALQALKALMNITI